MPQCRHDKFQYLTISIFSSKGEGVMVTPAPCSCSLPGGGAAGRERLDSAGTAGDSLGRRLGLWNGCVRHQSQTCCVFQSQRPGVPLSAVCLCETACAYLPLSRYTYEDLCHRTKTIQGRGSSSARGNNVMVLTYLKGSVQGLGLDLGAWW